MMEYMNEALMLKDVIISHRHYLHEHAELGFDLPMTRKYILDTLRKYGYDPEELGGGIVCSAGAGCPVILLRADMDALPMEENSGLPFASRTGAMHSCGHDSHVSMMLGAARIFKEHESEIHGTVKMIFQPAEELLAGAKAMVEAGVLESPHVDTAMGIHVGFGRQKEYYPSPGKVIIPEIMSSADEFHIRIVGKGSHGSMPETAVSPLVAGANIILAIEELYCEYKSGDGKAIISVGKFFSGEKANVIPEDGSLSGTIRTTDPEVRKQFKADFERIIREAAARNGAAVEIMYTLSVGTNINNADLTEEMIRYCHEIGVETEVIPKLGGSEDFSYISEKVPGFFAFLGAGGPDEGYEYPLHSPRAVFDENVLPYGTAVLVKCALSWIDNHNGEDKVSKEN